MLLKRYEINQSVTNLLALEHRVKLNDSERRKLQNQRAGYAGEELFFRMLDGIEGVIIWDLTLNDTDCVQYDFLVITDCFILISKTLVALIKWIEKF